MDARQSLTPVQEKIKHKNLWKGEEKIIYKIFKTFNDSNHQDFSHLQSFLQILQIIQNVIASHTHTRSPGPGCHKPRDLARIICTKSAKGH